MTKSVREISKELGITKQAVYQRMNAIDNFRDEHTHMIGNRIEIDDDGVKLITNFENNHKPKDQQERQKNSNINFDVIIEQLNVKDKQIANLQKSLDQQQQLQLATTRENNDLKQQINQLRIDSDDNKQEKQTELLDSDDHEVTENKPHFWQFWKH